MASILYPLLSMAFALDSVVPLIKEALFLSVPGSRVWPGYLQVRCTQMFGKCSDTAAASCVRNELISARAVQLQLTCRTLLVSGAHHGVPLPGDSPGGLRRDGGPRGAASRTPSDSSRAGGSSWCH